MSHAASIRALVLAVALVIVSAAPAHAGTIVFDFEDGLQGWELRGATQRVRTQILGGEWAIFGDGATAGTTLFQAAIVFQDGNLGISLANVERITLDALLVTATEGPLAEPITRISGPPSARVAIVQWDTFTLPPDGLGGQTFVAFIDNITFHTIPEPSVLGMLVMGGMAWRLRRRCVSRTAHREVGGTVV